MKRLTPATLTFGVMAIMGLLVSAYVVRTLLARDDKPPEVKTRNMPTPVADLPAGTLVTEKHLGSAPTLVSTLSPDMLASNSVIVGRVVREPLKKAVPIRANQLYAPGERPPLKLAAGMKAVTISLNDNTAIVDGLIKPGDYCDVQLTLKPAVFRDDRLPFGYQLTLFKGLKVLAINRNTVQMDPESAANTVTLQARPGQVNALILARESGTLTLTYSSSSKPGGLQVSDEDDDRLTLEKLLNLPPKPKPVTQPRPPEPYTVDEYRYLKRATVGFLPNGRVIDYWNAYGAYGYGTPWMGAGGGVGSSTSSAPGQDPAQGIPNTQGPLGAPGVGPMPQGPVTPANPNPGGAPNNGINGGNGVNGGAPNNLTTPGPTAFNGYPQLQRGQ